MTRAAFGLGANLGDARAALRDAVRLLRAELGEVRVSSLYRTAPVGGPPQPDYLNAVAVVDTEVPPKGLLALAQAVERAHRRTREVRWGPRTLDIDVLAVGPLVSSDPALTLPHPRAHQRAFVLVPWAELDPEFEVPGRGKVGWLLSQLPDDADVLPVSGPAWADQP